MIPAILGVAGAACLIVGLCLAPEITLAGKFAVAGGVSLGVAFLIWMVQADTTAERRKGSS